LEANADKLRDWLTSHADVVSKRGYVKTQNVTDPDSAKMKTSHGVIQGYTGVAAVDEHDQVIVYAEAFGEGQEQSTLAPMVDGLSRHLDAMNETLTGKRITADAGYHSEANVELLYARKIDGYVADTGMRGRDPRFAEADRHVDPRELRQQQKQRDARFQLTDFSYDAERATCYCPEGHRLTVRVGWHPTATKVFASRDASSCVVRVRAAPSVCAIRRSRSIGRWCSSVVRRRP